MKGHSKFLEWAREMYMQNCDERDAYKQERTDFDDYILYNIDYLIDEYIKVKA